MQNHEAREERCRGGLEDNLGVWIEDDVLVTEDGREVLSTRE